MGLLSVISNAFNNVEGWLDDTQDLLKGNLESEEYKDLKDQVSNSSIYIDTGRFVSLNDVLKRFHLGNEFQSDSHNDVFTSGFEDPTRLMFKIEFGDWGNSLLDIETIKNQQITSKFSNVYYEDYDQFPMGLLNLDFRDFSGVDSFNLQLTYNSYNYLLNNNEDARSQYLKQFILGLYAILKDMPYLFLKIQGVDKLQEFNATNGRRLKEAKITLDCIEGLDLKIRTLLELYRKAAYDDVWQRWVLPDIYRYFKMIIYVFDRRILHTGYGTYSVDQDNFPIYAFECGPCEFEIQSTMENDFSVSYADHKDAATQIIINVKNVKTYFSNKLLNKIDSLTLKTNWISDFDSVKERNSFTAVDQDNHENFRTRWLKRMFMTPSEYKAYYNNMTHKIGDEYDVNKLLYSNEIYGPILPKNSWHYAVVTDPIYSIQSWNGLKKYFKKLLTTRTTLIRDSRTDDRDIMQNDLLRPYRESYIYDYDMIFDDIKITLKQAIDYMREHIAQMIQHMLNSTYLINSETFYKIVDPGLINNYEKLDMEMINDTSRYLDKPNMELIKPIMNLDKYHVQMQNNTSMYLDKPVMNMVEPIINTDKYHVQMQNNTSMYLDKPDMELIKPIINTDKYHAQMQNNTSMYLDKPVMNMVEPIINTDKYHAQMQNNTSMYLDKPDMDFIEPIMNLDKLTHNFISPIFNLEKNKMNFVYPIRDIYKSDITFVYPIFDLTKFDMNLTEYLLDLHKANMNLLPDTQDNHKATMNLLSDEHDEHKAKMNLLPDNQDTHKVNMNLLSDEHDEHKVEMNMLSDNQDTHKVLMNLLSDEHDEYKTNMTLVKDYQDKHKPNMSLIPDNLDTHKAVMNLIPDNQDEFKSEMTLIKDYQDNHKPGMSLIPDNQDTHKSEMNMLIDNHDEHKVEMNMLSDNQDTHKSKMNMLIDNQDTHKVLMNLLPDNQDTHKVLLLNVSLINNLEKPIMDMVSPNMNTSIANMKFISPVMNTSIPTMDFIYPDMNTSLPDMKMISPDMNSSIPDMKMISPDMNTSLPGMKMVYPDMNSSLPEMDFIYPDMNTSLPDMKMISPDMNTSIPGMKMVKPDLNSSVPYMSFVHPISQDDKSNMLMQSVYMNLDKPNIEMIKPILNTSKIEMEMTEPILFTKVSDMVMTNMNIDVSKPTMDFIQGIRNLDKPNMVMSTYEVNDDNPKLKLLLNIQLSYNVEMLMNNNTMNTSIPTMKMQRPDMNTSIAGMKFLDNIPKDTSKPEMLMVNLTEDTSLVHKLEALTKIDVNELKTIGLDKLVSLATLIDTTVEEIKEHARNMKLQDNKPDIPKHVHMKMTRIPLPPRNQFMADKLINPVDDVAIDRAFAAKRNADNKDDYSTTGSYGSAM